MANNKSIHFLRGTGTAISRNSTLVLESGQPCYDLSTRKLYVGDGTTALGSLPAITAAAIDKGDVLKVFYDDVEEYATILASEGLNINDGVFIASSGTYIQAPAVNTNTVTLGGLTEITKDYIMVDNASTFSIYASDGGLADNGITVNAYAQGADLWGRDWYIHANGDADLRNLYVHKLGTESDVNIGGDLVAATVQSQSRVSAQTGSFTDVSCDTLNALEVNNSEGTLHCNYITNVMVTSQQALSLGDSPKLRLAFITPTSFTPEDTTNFRRDYLRKFVDASSGKYTKVNPVSIISSDSKLPTNLYVAYDGSGYVEFSDGSKTSFVASDSTSGTALKLVVSYSVLF